MDTRLKSNVDQSFCRCVSGLGCSALEEEARAKRYCKSIARLIAANPMMSTRPRAGIYIGEASVLHVNILRHRVIRNS